MKNIHILPTDKPSRLVQRRITKEIKTSLLDNPQLWNNINIYITSDEEIKEGDWFIFKDDNAYLFQSIGNTDNTHIKVKSDNEFGYGDWNIDYCKKIILTTDDQLIKDGIQAIPDKFLEWFVKNSSCESVGVEKGKMKLNDDGQEYGFPDMSKYKIIIPKEEPNIIDQWLEKNGNPEIAKQVEQEAKELCGETLEEAARKYASYNFDSSFLNIDDHFDAGAKWQQEQDKKMYSEEDLRNAFDSAREFDSLDGIVDVHIVLCMGGDMLDLQPLHITFDKWFEQFKKK
jgi:hypothetical protein